MAAYRRTESCMQIEGCAGWQKSGFSWLYLMGQLGENPLIIDHL